MEYFGAIELKAPPANCKYGVTVKSLNTRQWIRADGTPSDIFDVTSCVHPVNAYEEPWKGIYELIINVDESVPTQLIGFALNLINTTSNTINPTKNLGITSFWHDPQGHIRPDGTPNPVDDCVIEQEISIHRR